MKQLQWRKILPFLIPLVWMAVTGGVAVYFFKTVDLKPHVGEDFFFASDDPEFREGNEIHKLFPEYSQPVIISAKGDIHSSAYHLKAWYFTKALLRIPDTVAVHSITQGPRKVEEAFESPLWRRLLISKDGKATHFIVALRNVPAEKLVPRVERIEKIVQYFNDEDFKIIVSGPPYIIELIRRNLLQDLKVFSLASLVIFTVVMLAIFRSVWILLGTVTACTLASMGTLFITHLLQIPIGPLTANLSTIVFVLTLSYISFIAFTWKYVVEKNGREDSHPVADTLRLTCVATFWSMATAFPGFLSCIFVPAIPLRQLGIASSIGTVISFLAALLVFPWFLWPAKKGTTGAENFYLNPKTVRQFFSKKHVWASVILLVFAGICAVGILRLNADPNMLSYFKKGSLLREGLEYIDRNGGSSPLQMVIRDKGGEKLNSDEAYRKLWQLHRGLEAYSPVGTLLSQPLVMAEAERRIPFNELLIGLFGWNPILNAMEKPKHHKIATYFLTEDRTRSLLFLRMEEEGRTQLREEIVEKIKEIVRKNGFEPELVGGIYLLQGKLTQLVVRSLLMSLVSLIVIFAGVGFLLTGSIRLTLALFLSVAVIPATLLGIVGFSGIPVDLISSPASNISVGMGMDAMLHMLIWAKYCQKKKKMGLWDSWINARIHMWKPVVSDALIVCSGFGIFCFSTFPPTQRFGLAVVIGSFMCPLAALFVLPLLAGAPFSLGKLWKKLRRAR